MADGAVTVVGPLLGTATGANGRPGPFSSTLSDPNAPIAAALRPTGIAFVASIGRAVTAPDRKLAPSELNDSVHDGGRVSVSVDPASENASPGETPAGALPSSVAVTVPRTFRTPGASTQASGKEASSGAAASEAAGASTDVVAAAAHATNIAANRILQRAPCAHRCSSLRLVVGEPVGARRRARAGRVVTVTSTAVPDACGGARAMISFAETGRNKARLVPKLTTLARLRFVPLMSTRVNPPPVPGDTPVTVGAVGAFTVRLTGLL